MNSTSIIRQLKRLYPGKAIIKNPQDNSTEIICEIDPGNQHPEYSMCISIIGESKPHVHRKIIETYTVIKGTAFIVKNKTTHTLSTGETITIAPGITHSVRGKEAWILCLAQPAWTPKDHSVV